MSDCTLPVHAPSPRPTGPSLTWVVTAYTLSFGGLMLLGGRLADTFGRRRIFLTGLGLFTVAWLASGLAQGGTTLIAARAGQGVGAALLPPAALAIITTTFEGAERNRALGVWAAIAGAGAAVGVLAGGLLVESPTSDHVGGVGRVPQHLADRAGRRAGPAVSTPSRNALP